MRLILYDNFKTTVEMEEGPEGPMRVLTLLDHDTSTMHRFAYPLDAASKVGAAMQGTSVVTAPADAVDRLEAIRRGDKPRG